MGAGKDGAAAGPPAAAGAAEGSAGDTSTVAGLFRRWRGLAGGLDLARAPDAAVEAFLEQRLHCRLGMAAAQSRGLAELRMKLAVLHAELADALEPDEAEDAANLALLGSALADLAAIEGADDRAACAPGVPRRWRVPPLGRGTRD